MYFGNFKKWIQEIKVQENNVWEYDFVENTIASIDALEKYCELERVFDKYFVYRASGYKKTHNKYLKEEAKNKLNIFLEKAKKCQTRDPDLSSNLLREIYIYLWGEDFMENYCKCSDTMTSAQTLLNNCIECVYDQEMFKNVYMTDSKVRVTSNSSIVMAVCSKNSLYELLGTNFNDLERFLKLYHTIGNYTPVPEGFNQARSLMGKKDFWDLTLMYIRDYYLKVNKEDKNTIIRGLLNIKGNEEKMKIWLEKMKVWLDNYGDGLDGWKKFVEKNFFQDYVDENFEVKPFWEGHNYKNLELPKCKEEINELLKKLCCIIEKRGKRIIEAIKKSID